MKSKATLLGVSVVAMAIFGWLVVDALTFALSPSDPISGRIRGCYAFVENIVGVLEPSDTFRQSQVYVGSFGLLTVCGYLIRALAKRAFGRGNVNPVA